MSAQYRLALLTGLVASGCSSATAGPGQPGTPSPEPGEPTVVTPVPGGGAAAVTYRPVQNAPYTLIRHDSLTLQLPGGANQLQLIDRTAYLRLTITTDTGGLLASIVLDSLEAAVGGVPAVLDSIIPALGTRWTARLTADGELSALKSDRSSTLGDQIGSNLRYLFPSLPQGGVRAGMQWTDTTEVPIRADAFDAIERSLTRYQAESSDDAEAALRLDSQGSYRRKGQGTQYDQKLEMTASGTRSATHLLGLDGKLVSARGNDAGEMTITVPAVGQSVPVKQAGTYSITSNSASARRSSQ